MKQEIRELMELKGWTQAELAAEIGVSESTAFRWHEGQSTPIPSLQKILRKQLASARTSPPWKSNQPDSLGAISSVG